MSIFIDPDRDWQRERAAYNADEARHAERAQKLVDEAHELTRDLQRAIIESPSLRYTFRLIRAYRKAHKRLRNLEAKYDLKASEE